MKKTVLTLLAAYTLLAAQAKTIYVDIDATGSNNGTSWTNAYTDLQVALNSTIFQDELWIAEGNYTQNTTNRDSAFQWTTPMLKLYGGFAGTETTLSERDASINKTILSGDIGTKGDISDNLYTVLFGFYLKPGQAAPKGGDSTWIDGITIQDGNANDASDGTQVHRFRGGGYSLSSGTNYIQFSSCHFANNAALSGGALNLRDLDNNYRYINFYNCQFTKNKAGRASLADINGKYLSGLNTFFVNCIIAENEGTNEGNRNASLIYYESNGSTVRTNLYIHGCTITNNLEASKDAFSPAPLIGVNKPDFAHQMNLEIVNTIVYNNEAPSTYKKLNTWDPKATRIHNCILESTDLPLNDLTQSNITSVDPKFLGGTTDRKYAPSEGSPAINAAKAMPSASITALQTEVDIFGTPRVADSTELGAIEYVRAEPIKTSVKRVDVTTATVYPNPATNTISMKGIQGNVVVSILNMLGAEVLKTNTTQNINISNLPAGVYTIINSQEGSVSQAKFIKK